MVTCKKTDTLISIMDKIVKAEVHRLVIVDDEDKVAGMISLSDILAYLVLRPCGKLTKEMFDRNEFHLIITLFLFEINCRKFSSSL